jgi:hypothetical protein
LFLGVITGFDIIAQEIKKISTTTITTTTNQHYYTTIAVTPIMETRQ